MEDLIVERNGWYVDRFYGAEGGEVLHLLWLRMKQTSLSKVSVWRLQKNCWKEGFQHGDVRRAARGGVAVNGDKKVLIYGGIQEKASREAGDGF